MFRALCTDCFATLELTRLQAPLCCKCGRPFAAGTALDSTLCLNCRIKAPYFEKARALFPYRGPAGAVIKAFKYHDRYHLGPALLEEAIRADWLPDGIDECVAVIPVPLHWRQRHRRGYNQAELLAKKVAGHLSRPYLPGLLRRVRHTGSQAKLAAGQRIKNVKGAFKAEGPLPAGSVLLVDDVLTTGATADECARELKRAGCTSVFVFTLVRARI